MKRLTALVLGFLLITSVAYADYTTHQIVFNDGNTIGVEFRSVVVAESPKTLYYQVRASSSFTDFRQWVGQQFADLNFQITVAKLTTLEVGKSVTPIAPVVPSAVEIAATAWATKVTDLEADIMRRARITALGVTATGAFATAITALDTSITNQKAAINTDYNNADAATRTAMQGKL